MIAASIKIDNIRKTLLQLILNEPKIRSTLMVDGMPAKQIIVDGEGNVLLGKGSNSWLNWLFNRYDKIDFFTLVSKIAVCVAPQNDCDQIITEAINRSLRNGEKDSVIDLLFDYIRLGGKDMELKSKFMKFDYINKNNNSNNNKSSTKMVGEGMAYVDMGPFCKIPLNIVFEKNV